MLSFLSLKNDVLYNFNGQFMHYTNRVAEQIWVTFRAIQNLHGDPAGQIEMNSYFTVKTSKKLMKRDHKKLLYAAGSITFSMCVMQYQVWRQKFLVVNTAVKREE